MEFLNDLLGIQLGSISLGSVFSAIIAYVICLAAIKLLCRAADRLLNSAHRLDESLKSFFSSAIKAGLWAIAVIIIAGTLGIPVNSLVAVLSVVGVALSLALQGLLSNLFSGITLLTTHPFKVGDYVQIGDESGTVKSIGLFYTGMAAPDNRMIFVPNGNVTSAQIINFTAQETRRVIIGITASYDCATETVRMAALDAASSDGRIFKEPAPFVAISSYGSSSVEYTVRVWCKTEDYWDVYYALNENLRTSFEKFGVEMCYDHLNVHLIGSCPPDAND